MSKTMKASVKFYSENKNLKKKGTPLCDKVFSDQTNTTKDGVPYEKQYKVF